MRLVELQTGADLETLLRRLYCIEELPIEEVGERIGIPGLTAGNWIRKFHLDRRSMSRKRAQDEELAASGPGRNETQGSPAAPARSSVEGDRHDSSAASRGNTVPSTDDDGWAA